MAGSAPSTTSRRWSRCWSRRAGAIRRAPPSGDGGLCARCAEEGAWRSRLCGPPGRALSPIGPVARPELAFDPRGTRRRPSRREASRTARPDHLWRAQGAGERCAAFLRGIGSAAATRHHPAAERSRSDRLLRAGADRPPVATRSIRFPRPRARVHPALLRHTGVHLLRASFKGFDTSPWRATCVNALPSLTISS